MFCLSFIVAFQKQELEKKKKQAKNPEKSKKAAKPEEPVDPKFIDCSQNFKTTCHIEYNLHEQFSYNIDIACWGRAAKIYTNEEVICARSFIVDDLSVVCFSILHATKNEFNTDDIANLFKFTVTFKFNEDKNSLMAVSKNDNPKFFYDFKKPPEFQNNEVDVEFCNVFETASFSVPDFVQVKEITLTEMEKRADVSSSNNGTNNYIHALTCVPSTFHKKTLIKLIRELRERRISFTKKQMDEQPLPNNEIGVKGKKNNKTKEKGRAKKGIDPEQCTIKFGADQFLLDRVYDVHEKFNLSPNLPYAAVVHTSKNILKGYMTDYLVPFSIIIKKIYNLPQPDMSISKVFLNYSFGEIIKEPIETEKVDLKTGSKIKINHAKMFLMPNIKLADLVQGIQTGSFYIKVFGVCKKKENLVPKVYGLGEMDNRLGLSHTDRYNTTFTQRKLNCVVNNADNTLGDGTEVCLLAYAAVDLSPLMNGPFWLRVYCNLTSRSLKINESTLMDNARLDEEVLGSFAAFNNQFLNLNFLNINEDKTTNFERSYFTDSELIKCGSFIKVMAKIDVQMKPTLLSQCLQSTDCYSRGVVIVYDQNLASSILNSLIMVNEAVGGVNEAKLMTIALGSLVSVVNENILTPGTNVSLASNEEFYSPVSSQDVILISSNMTASLFLTGFVIDCVDKTIIMVEGYTNLTFPRVLTHLYRLDPSKAKVLYNSDLVFTQRFYKSFLPSRKIAVITMIEPLSSILTSCHVYLEGNVPSPAWQALLKLDLLSRSETMDAICRNNLLLTPDELMSFDIEFGVPVQTFSETLQNLKHRCQYLRSRKKKN